MNYLSILLAFFAPSYMVFGQQGPCVIPSNGGLGQCRSIFKCQSLLSVVNQAVKTLQDKDLLYKSYCGIEDDTPAVCCPKQNETQPCNTPEGKLGECISLYSCPQIVTLLRQRLTDDIREFVRKSQCDGTDQYSVCCGPVPRFDVVKGNCELTAFPPDPKTECCGFDSSYQSKIIGVKSPIEQNPWLVLIEFNNNGKQQVYGMGTLISGKYVLAPALEAQNEILGKIANIILGEYDTSNDGDPDCVEGVAGGMDCTDAAVKIPVEEIIPHPEYNTKLRINDISLIRMKRTVFYTDFIRPICLPTADVTLQSEPFYLTTAGWGATSTKQFSSNIKFEVDLPYVSRDKCQRAYSSEGRRAMIRETQLCAGGEEGKDICNGDGALMYINGSRYEIVGVASFGAVPCGQKDVPGVYTNVFKYNDWIRKNIVP